MKTAFAVGAVVFVFGACATAPREGTSRGCTLAAADSVFLAGGPLFLDCSVDRPAVVRAQPIERPAGPVRAGTCAHAEVKFVVGPDGRPEPGTVRLVRGNDPAFSDAVVASVPLWRYTPALLDGVPVRQLVRVRRAIAVVVAVGGARPTPPPNCR